MIGMLAIMSQLYGSVYAKFGPDSNMNYYNRKYIAFGYTDTITDTFDYQVEVGGWRTVVPGERSSLYSSYQLGLKTRGEFYCHAFTGVAALSNPDNRLSSLLQFKHDIGIGFRDKRNVGIGVDYSHISNAGITLPNLGRDIVQLRVELPFN